MREYSTVISLNRNSRGVYTIDTTIGCSSGLANDKRGCYFDCYAAKSAKLYGYDFSKTVLRYFENRAHENKIIAQINRAKLDFVRIGNSGDPSENWEHTVNVLRVISKSNKEIVIITKHWTILTDTQLEFLNKINVCINTSVSALDEPTQLIRSVEQYNRIKAYCKSVLRIVSADFNLENETGLKMSKIQHDLFKNEDTLDTVLRVNKSNPYLKDGIINVTKSKFLGKNVLMSKLNRKTYFGNCNNCLEMCGQKMNNENYSYPNKKPLTKQLSLF